MWFKVGKKFCCISLSSLQFSNFPSVLLFTVWITYLACIPDKPVCNWRAQSKNDPLIFRPFLKVSTCQNSTEKSRDHSCSEPSNCIHELYPYSGMPLKYQVSWSLEINGDRSEFLFTQDCSSHVTLQFL